MPSHPISRLPVALEMPEIPEKSVTRDRRKRPRAQIHWPVFFSQPNSSEIIQTSTHDLSSDGFYCVANAGFVPGESRDCTLVVPTHHPHGGTAALPVLCKVRIIRVELLSDDGLYGIGCQITDYRFAAPSAPYASLVASPELPETRESQIRISDRSR